MKNKSKQPPIDTAPLPPLQLPPGPYVDRDGQAPVLTEAGVAAVELLAKEGFTQSAIASHLSVTGKTFKTLIAKADDDPPTPARAAWEAGRAALESELVRLALASARKGGMIQQLFLLKSQFGHRDQGPQTVIESPRVAFVMPGSLSETEYYKKLGIEGPIDTRPEHMRGLTPFQIMGLPSPTESNPTTEGENHVEESKS